MSPLKILNINLSQAKIKFLKIVYSQGEMIMKKTCSCRILTIVFLFLILTPILLPAQQKEMTGPGFVNLMLKMNDAAKYHYTFKAVTPSLIYMYFPAESILKLNLEGGGGFKGYLHTTKLTVRALNVNAIVEIYLTGTDRKLATIWTKGKGISFRKR